MTLNTVGATIPLQLTGFPDRPGYLLSNFNNYNLLPTDIPLIFTVGGEYGFAGAFPIITITLSGAGTVITSLTVPDPVPEPASVFLLTTGLAGVLLGVRNRRKSLGR